MMTIEQYIKKAMIKCPLTDEQEGALLKGLEDYLDEIELVKNCSIPDVVGRSEQLPCERCKKMEFMIENGLGWKDMENDCT